MLIDSHVHLDHRHFDADRVEVLERSRRAGVTRWIVPALTELTANALLGAPWRTPDVFVTAGFHPHEVESVDPARLRDLEALVAERPEIVAIGETGLDYHYDLRWEGVQKQFLEFQIGLAERFEKPLVIHARDGNGRSAYRDLLDMTRATGARGVLHCFTGSTEIAEEALALGWYLGLNGVVTFGKSDELRRTFQSIPKDRIVLETDAPYLAPVPHRGKRNEPGYLFETARCAAGLFGLTLEELDLWITSNTERLFRLSGGA